MNGSNVRSGSSAATLRDEQLEEAVRALRRIAFYPHGPTALSAIAVTEIALDALHGLGFHEHRRVRSRLGGQTTRLVRTPTNAVWFWRSFTLNRYAAPIRYRKRPVVIEAMQYTWESRDAVIAWSGAQHTSIGEEGERYELRELWINTLEGQMRADLGDWIVKGVQGEFYPVKLAIFKETYEPAE